MYFILPLSLEQSVTYKVQNNLVHHLDHVVQGLGAGSSDQRTSRRALICDRVVRSSYRGRAIETDTRCVPSHTDDIGPVAQLADATRVDDVRRSSAEVQTRGTEPQ